MLFLNKVKRIADQGALKAKLNGLMLMSKATMGYYSKSKYLNGQTSPCINVGQLKIKYLWKLNRVH